ncbi:MAG TPA: ATP-binding protein [Candidatus Moranbacteria bacterium]|nr:ATP-binding protein [Candidatus Moranbacteria bacterium]
MIKRKITEEIKTLAKEFPIVAIMGPRQSGKTTIAKHIFKKYKYVSLEDYDKRKIAMDDPRGFLKQYDKNVIIDEIQRVPELFSYLQTHIDEIKTNGSFVLTGSQNYLLMENITQSLAGRVGLATLFPLSLEELPTENKSNIYEVIFKGFYPRIFDQKIRPSSFYKTYLNTYLEKDIRLIKNISDYNLFLKFLKLLAGRSGQILNIQTIADDVGIANKTVESWLSILETSFIIYRLQPYHKNYNKRVVKSSKLFFYDVGLVCYLLGIKKPEELENYYQFGNLFENFIISDLMKYNYNYGELANFYFWKDGHNNEIDLLIESGNKIKVIEIKSAQTFREEFLKNMSKFSKLEKTKKVEQFLLYGGDENLQYKGTKIISWNSLKNLKKTKIFE